MLTATFDVNGDVIGRLKIGRLHYIKSGPRNDYEVEWKAGTSPYATRRRAEVLQFDRDLGALELVRRAIEAIQRERKPKCKTVRSTNRTARCSKAKARPAPAASRPTRTRR